MVQDEGSFGIADRPSPLPPTVLECEAIPPVASWLDEHQLTVVRWRRGEAVVAAAAGAGKSTVLKERLAALTREGVPADQILTLVYNRDATEKLRASARTRLGFNLGQRVQVHTFHGFAYSLVREWWPRDFGKGRLVDADDGPSSHVLSLAVAEEMRLNRDGVDLKALVRLSELAREALIDVEGSQSEVASRLMKDLPVDLLPTAAEQVATFARLYQREKAKRKLIDFSDMLYIVNQVIAFGGARAKMLRMRFAHVQVDEAQDAAASRARLAVFLGEGARSLVWVLDFRQNIYSFAGARPDILRDRIDKHGATLLTLPVNRRSTSKIVEAGNKISRGKDWNVGGDCLPSKETPDAEEVHIWLTESESEEADQVAKEILARSQICTCGATGTCLGTVDDGFSDLAYFCDKHCDHSRGTCTPLRLKEFSELRGKNEELPIPLATSDGRANYVCLVRTNGYAAQLECTFFRLGIPCRVLGAQGGIWSTVPGRELLAYLRAAGNRPDKDLVRVANKPARFIKRAAVEEAALSENPISFMMASTSSRLRQLGQDLHALGALPWNERVQSAVEFLLRDLRERTVEEADTEPDEDKAETYRFLGRTAAALGSVEAIDAQVAAMKKLKKTDPAVEICTGHRSKGQEWNTVFVCGVCDGTWPHTKARDVEEERRLFYVSVTRAREVCIISCGGDPSPFLTSLTTRVRDQLAKAAGGQVQQVESHGAKIIMFPRRPPAPGGA